MGFGLSKPLAAYRIGRCVPGALYSIKLDYSLGDSSVLRLGNSYVDSILRYPYDA